MKTKPYHHGNLKEEFIERGLEYIDKYGVESLSMRKLAEEIGVSSAAPYAHFKNKDAFLDSVQEYITDSLIATLKESIDTCKDREKLLLKLGKNYVLFFYENPLYYQFLFSKKDLNVKDYEPFVIFKEVAMKTIERIYGDKITKGKTEKKIIALWSMVHGLAQIAMMEGVINKKKLDREIEEILCAVEI